MPLPSRASVRFAPLIAAMVTLLPAVAAACPLGPPSFAVGPIAVTSFSVDDCRVFFPTIAGTTLSFAGNNFAASANAGAASTVSERISFTATLPPGARFEGVTLSAAGAWSVAREARLTADLFLFVTNLDQPTVPPLNPLTGSGLFERDLLASPAGGHGNWNLDATVVFPPEWRRIRVTANSILQVRAGPAGAGSIAHFSPEALRIDLVIPEPSGTAVAAVGGLMLRLRRREAVRSRRSSRMTVR